MVDSILSCEPDMLQISKISHISDRSQRLLIQFANLYNQELVAIIGWARQIPGFSNLLLNDQMRLLQSTWIEILTFCLTWRSLPNTGKLYFTPNIYLDEKIARRCHCSELYFHYMQILEKMQQLGLAQKEYFVFKALILANSDIKLDEPQALYRFRETILNWLSDSVAAARPSQDLHATQNMFLVLPSLRQIDEVTRKFWCSVYWSGKIPMDNLFIEMLGITRSQ